ncbi:hypothetical protein KXD40_009164 [Peronospora effusa]|uniref:Uncharacterized protein n=1 Tax=Peronospora effusa TaxID=542832 RepID=A0A3M6VNH9_9STRA|nr:hypothetical protein DD238_005522 [Peronospora effusa]RQM10817.1 hypothetical protein DD237_006914 [Peronospora effusa]UIZ25281.1 hypothetical protein KXD40_009164 [Peronospora effusa]
MKSYHTRRELNIHQDHILTQLRQKYAKDRFHSSSMEIEVVTASEACNSNVWLRRTQLQLQQSVYDKNFDKGVFANGECNDEQQLFHGIHDQQTFSDASETNQRDFQRWKVNSGSYAGFNLDVVRTIPNICVITVRYDIVVGFRCSHLVIQKMPHSGTSTTRKTLKRLIKDKLRPNAFCTTI